jgi:phosphoglucomutase
VISVRPSGTEPKIKFYFELRSELKDKADYESTLNRLNEKYQKIIKELGLKN